MAGGPFRDDPLGKKFQEIHDEIEKLKTVTDNAAFIAAARDTELKAKIANNTDSVSASAKFRDFLILALVAGAYGGGFAFMTVGQADYDALAARVDLLELDPPDHEEEDRRHRITQEQDLRLCQRTCDFVIHELASSERPRRDYYEHEYVGAACDWRHGGVRRCECECGVRQQQIVRQTLDRNGVPTSQETSMEWRPIIAEVRESR
jgi:hypothetical protein